MDGAGRLTVQDLPTRNPAVTQSNRVGVVRLTGSAPAAGTIAVPAAALPAIGELAGRDGATLRFALAAVAADGGPLDVVVELSDGAGTVASLPLSDVGGVLRPIAPDAMKSRVVASLGGVSLPVSEGGEIHLQTYALPMAWWVRQAPDFDPGTLASITFRLRGPAGAAMALDEVGVDPGP